MEDDFGDLEDDSEEAVRKRKLQKEVRERDRESRVLYTIYF